MITLVANFNIEFPGVLFFKWPENEEIIFNFSIDEFSIKIQFIPDSNSRSKDKDDEDWSYYIKEGLIQVSKMEEIGPPVVNPDENGIRDYSIQSEYFSKRIIEYGAIAQLFTNKLIDFFKFNMKTPYLYKLHGGHECFQNAKWTDDSGKEIGKGTTVFVAKRRPGVWGELGVKKFTPESISSLNTTFEESLDISLHEEILSEAQTALFENNIRRAVLEIAIACEILIKRYFFKEQTPAGAAFDYLEDKAQVRVRVLDFIDKISMEAFNKSYKIDHSEHFKNIDCLFRCRNKVAHRGVLAYRDDGGNTIEVDNHMVTDWWNSVTHLMNWFNALPQ